MHTSSQLIMRYGMKTVFGESKKGRIKAAQGHTRQTGGGNFKKDRDNTTSYIILTTWANKYSVFLPRSLTEIRNVEEIE